MKIKNAAYLLTAVKPEQYPEPALPAVAFIGRSNVGKSSLINTLVRRKSLARISGQPGKTRTINFYLIDDAWYLVDLPGYGFAKVSKEQRGAWKKMLAQYIEEYKGEKFYLQLLDIRHEPSREDVLMWHWLVERGCACGVVATKADKISRGVRSKHLAALAKALEISPEEILVFSSVSKEGREELLEAIGACLSPEDEAAESE